MIKTISKLALFAALIAPAGAFAADATAVTTKGYVDSGLIQKQNKATLETDVAAAGFIKSTDQFITNQAGFEAAGTTAGYLTSTDMTGYATTTQADAVSTAEQAAIDAVAYDDTALAGRVTATESDITALETATAGMATSADIATAIATDNTTDAATFMDATETGTAITAAIANKADKHTCAAGEMLLAGANGAVSCVAVENGTYTETVTP
jgi:hypothetical protein